MTTNTRRPIHDTDDELAGARAQPRPQRDETFHRGMFAVGAPRPRTIVETDVLTEYSLLVYLAAVTAGQRIAVGTLHCPLPMTRAEYERCYPGLRWRAGTADWIYEPRLVVVPDVGVWLCQTVWDSAAEALELAEADLGAIGKRLERDPSDLPVNIALVSVDPANKPDLRGIDPMYYFDTELFADVEGSLRRRARPTPPMFDEFVDELLSLGTWIDAKSGEWDLEMPVPEWIAKHLIPM